MSLSATIDREEATRRARRWGAKLLRDYLRPPPRLSVSEWSDAHRMLPETAAEPGRWRTSRTPYLRELMDAFSDPLVERVVFMKAAQVGGSEALLNVLGYYIDQDPAPILLVQVSDGEAAKFSKERVAPMISDTPVLTAKVSSPRGRGGGNTIESKDFTGGHLGIVGANAPSKLRARPRRVVLFDEVDGYPPSAGAEGDPIELGVKRTSTFWNRKIGMISTPTVKGHSRIENAFHESDQRYYHVPCPHCDTMQPLIWDRLKWETEWVDGVKVPRPETASYECVSCERLIAESHKPRMLAAGQWVANAEDRVVRGYHLNALYSPWYTWAELVREFLAAKGHANKLRVFVNTRLAETFEERGDAPPWRRLYERREDYPIGTCPEGVEFLTAGADVQDNRIEVFVWGWGAGKESWLIDHQIVPGDPFDPSTWPAVTALLHGTYPAADGGTLPIARFAIDTGFAQETVVGWARMVADQRVMLVKGDHWRNWNVIVGSPSRSDVTWKGRRTGLQLWPVGGALIKQETYGFFRLDAPLDGEPYPPGYIHLPQVDEEVVQQLVAEDLMTRTNTKGFAVREWVKNRARNEALDCRVYARAAAEQMGLGRMEAKSADPQMLAEQAKALRATEERLNQQEDQRRPRGGWLDTNRRRGGWL